MFLSELYEFEGFLNTLDRIMSNYAYFSEEEYIFSYRDELAQNKNIAYTDARDDNIHVIIEFDVLDNDPEYDDIWVKVTNYYEE